MYTCCTQVFHNIEGDDNWAECFNAPNIDLPTGYYFGFSAATGDLAGLSVCLCVHLLEYFGDRQTITTSYQ